MSERDTAREQRLRRMAGNVRHRLERSRVKHTSWHNQGLYRLVEERSNEVVIGVDWDADLDAVEDYLRKVRAWGPDRRTPCRGPRLAYDSRRRPRPKSDDSEWAGLTKFAFNVVDMKGGPTPAPQAARRPADGSE